MTLRKTFAATVVAIGTVVLAASAAAQQPRADKDDGENQLVCKSQQATGTRFAKRICRTKAEWETIREQHIRDAKAMIDRPQSNPGRSN